MAENLFSLEYNCDNFISLFHVSTGVQGSYMPKPMMIDKIEHEIEVLAPADQRKLYNWFGSLLKRTHRAETWGKAEITARINKVYAGSPPDLDRGAQTAQLASLEKEAW